MATTAERLRRRLRRSFAHWPSPKALCGWWRHYSRHNKKVLLAVAGLATAVLVCFFAFQWDALCIRARSLLASHCSLYKGRKVFGNLCEEICLTSAEKGVFPSQCSSGAHSGKPVVFKAVVEGRNVYVKGRPHGDPSFLPLRGVGRRRYPEQAADFRDMVLSYLKDNYGISLPASDAFTQLFALDWNIISDSEGIDHQFEVMENAWLLVQDPEYVFSTLFQNLDLFPHIYGTCGSLYVVEDLEELPSAGFFRKEPSFVNYAKKVAVAIAIMDLLEEMDAVFHEPLHLCDVKPSHFGISEAGTVKFLDLDSVFLESILVRAINDTGSCETHADCDFFDCKGECDLIKGKCRSKVVNNSLQVVCEKVFLGAGGGWLPDVISSGLLSSKHASHKLQYVLESCGNPSGSKDRGIRLATPDNVKLELRQALEEIVNFATGPE